MDQAMMNTLKAMKKDERTAYLNAKPELLASIKAMAGGVPDDNPNSECPDGFNHWDSSFGFVCQGRRQC